MSRPRLELQPTYGKLTVVSDFGGTKTLVRCECGDQKWVLRTNLRAGRIKSCGNAGCRVYTSGFAPAPLARSSKAPTWLPTDAIPGVFARAQQPGGVLQLSTELQVSDTTIYNLITTVREHGGIEAYMQFLSSDQRVTKAAQRQAPANLVTPGEVTAPPKLYDPSSSVY